MDKEKILQIINQKISQNRFSLPQTISEFIDEALKDSMMKKQIDFLKKVIGEKQLGFLIKGLFRSVFFIELVKKPKIETTKYETRWGDRLDTTDPRFLDFENCLLMFESLLIEIIEIIEESNNLQILNLFSNYHIIPYEIPIDYVQRENEKIHTISNLKWFFNEDISRVLKLRSLLLDEEKNSEFEVFEKAYEKIEVKTYLTDRVLTGAHKTDREKRWETHPESVHFALRRDCLMIEEVLINQVLFFSGFPKKIRDEIAGQIPLIYEKDFVVRCPITKKPLVYADFKDEIISPIHGKANFQVGHLNPLKAEDLENGQNGHVAANIAWISSEGNRIQGDLNLEEIQNLIIEIFNNYRDLGIL